MSDSSTLMQVEKVLRTEFPSYQAAVTRDTTAADVDGWDSLGHTTFILMLERALGIEIDPEASLEFSDIGALVDYIDQNR